MSHFWAQIYSLLINLLSEGSASKTGIDKVQREQIIDWMNHAPLTHVVHVFYFMTWPPFPQWIIILMNQHAITSRLGKAVFTLRVGLTFMFSNVELKDSNLSVTWRKSPYCLLVSQLKPYSKRITWTQMFFIQCRCLVTMSNSAFKHSSSYTTVVQANCI